MAIVYIVRGEFGRVYNMDLGWVRDEYNATDYSDFDGMAREWKGVSGVTFEAVDTDKREAKHAKEVARKARAKVNRQARESALRSCGLKKARGNLGGIYWE